jgi:recombinational DNA repair protein RecT
MKKIEILEIKDKSKLVDDPAIRESFINTLCRIHKKSAGEAEMIFEREAIYYKKALANSEKLLACTGLSLYSAFLEIAITGLSIQPGSKSEAYLEAKNAEQNEVKEKDGKPYYVKVQVKVCRLVLTAYGELNLRILSGQIVRINNPIVIYEGDRFQPRTNERGELTVDYAPAIPRKSNKIVGAWCSIVLPGNRIDFKWLLEDDINRLANYSTYGGQASVSKQYTKNSGQIDPGFLEAKCIKHAMRAYTKLRISDNIAFEDDEQDKPDNSGFAPPESESPKETVTIRQPEEDPDMPY